MEIHQQCFIFRCCLSFIIASGKSSNLHPFSHHWLFLHYMHIYFMVLVNTLCCCWLASEYTFVMFISPVDTVWVDASHSFLLLLSLFGLLVENASVISVKRDSNLSILSVLSRVESANILFTISIESVKLNGGGWSWFKDKGCEGDNNVEEGDARLASPRPL